MPGIGTEREVALRQCWTAAAKGNFAFRSRRPVTLAGSSLKITRPRDPWDDIIAAFNKRRFNAWRATPEEQRVKPVNVESA